MHETFGGIQAFRVVGFENGMPVMDNKDKDDDGNSDISISDLFDDDDVPLVIDETYLKDPVDFMGGVVSHGAPYKLYML